ncbi:serine hydrolase domain-containing protein [Paenibacillus alkalitolerans]|uniref:serine hydrolase domain-containing protein n=1 Tax=Paenibacillus alkalitolerans TaxID=2799335 RepID=UPI0018F4C409|nr:serine hydrolase domain-containing protein [Paenibacillus alkalitolerans]
MASASTTAIHEGRTDTAPERVGLDSQRLEVLDRHFIGLIDAGKLQGASYLLARDGKIAAHRSMGKLTFKDDGKDLLPDSVRKVYSITKVVTAVAIGQLVEQGKLFWQQPVADVIKEFDTDLHRKITIWHLLTHTSGLAGDPGQNMEPYSIPWYEWHAWEKKQKADKWEAGDWVKLMLAGPLRAKPGEEWIYCTSGFGVLGEIIARVSGQSFEDYLNDRIFKPLGMNHSFFTVPEELRKETCYTGEWEEKEIFEPPLDRTGMPPRGGNGLYSTLEDLWKFGQAMLDGGSFGGSQILGRRTIQMIVSNQLRNVRCYSWGQNNNNVKHGIGWSLNSDDICSPGTYSHEGFGHSGLYIDPKERLVFVYFVPNRAGWVAEAVINPRAIAWSSII